MPSRLILILLYYGTSALAVVGNHDSAVMIQGHTRRDTATAAESMLLWLSPTQWTIICHKNTLNNCQEHPLAPTHTQTTLDIMATAALGRLWVESADRCHSFAAIADDIILDRVAPECDIVLWVSAMTAGTWCIEERRKLQLLPPPSWCLTGM